MAAIRQNDAQKLTVIEFRLKKCFNVGDFIKWLDVNPFNAF